MKTTPRTHALRSLIVGSAILGLAACQPTPTLPLAPVREAPTSEPTTGPVPTTDPDQPTTTEQATEVPCDHSPCTPKAQQCNVYPHVNRPIDDQEYSMQLRESHQGPGMAMSTRSR